ncbi:MAG: DNA phosphorothioation-associated protein 4 [Burkholderiales bacterium]|nr:DNA phosphorothioation-associated protein 4 [Burkholderiales bacterium]
MRDIRRPDKTEHVVERLTSPQFSEINVSVFPTIMDLLIFAAGIGLSIDRRTPVPASGKAIPMRIFENNNKDGFIYLLNISLTKDPKCLGSDNDDELVKNFEEYAAGGLEEIENWLNENATDISGVQTIISKIQALLPSDNIELNNPNPI